MVENESVWKFDQMSLTNLTRQIVAIRFIISQSVNRLESFYTFTTVLGALSIGPMMEYRIIDAPMILRLVVFLILQCIFIYFIYSISKSRDDIRKVIKSPSVMFKYLTKIKSMHNVQVLRNELAKTDNSDEISKLNKFKISAYSPVTFDRITDLEASTAEVELLTLGYKNNAELDWIILDMVLSDEWTNFNLLGMSFNDTNVIKKSIGITSLIILGSTYFNSLKLF